MQGSKRRYVCDVVKAKRKDTPRITKCTSNTAFDTDSLKYALKQVNAAQGTLAFLRKNNTPTPTISLKCNESSKKDIQKQKRFYSSKRTERKRKVD